MKIVVEYVLLENFLINLIILKTTANVLKEKGRLFFVSAVLGACVTVVIPLLFLNSLGELLLQVGLAVFYICISFKFKTIKKFARLYVCHFVVTLLYGGACFFFERLFGIESVIVVLLVVVFTFLCVKFLLKVRNRKKMLENFCFEIQIVAGDKTTKWKAFLDSGNLLFDPLTDSPVSLINYKVFSALYKDIDLEDILRRTKKLKQLKLAHYINFNTLGANNKILVFQVDKVVLENGSVLENATLGLALKNFNEAFGTDVILHNNLSLA